MKAVSVVSIENQEVQVKEVPIPKPKAGELLIRVQAAPINPSDQYYMKGVYNPSVKVEVPYTVGYEGAGIVVGVGEGVDETRWLEKKLSFLNRGTWAEYIIIPESYKFKMVMSDKVNCIDIASCWVNPITVMFMYDVARKAGIQTIVHNAGASTLGQQLIKLGQQKGFDTINVVRREEQVQALISLGAKYVINQSNEGWQKEFHDMTRKLGGTILFDAIGGDIAGQFLTHMPHNSTLYNYGLLSGKPLSGFSPDLFIFEWKSIKGLGFTSILETMTPLDLKDYFGTVAEDLNNGGKIFGSKIAKKYPLEQFKEAVEYANAHTLEGKYT